jgi:hypothetical protein
VTTIVVPWRDTSPERATACRVTSSALRELLPGSPLILADSGHTVFNRSASRNTGIRHLPDAEVVVVCDADLLLERQPLLDAVAAAQDGRLHYPFTHCWYLDERHTTRVLAGADPQAGTAAAALHGAEGGVFVMQAGAWRGIGGMNEEFTGWGYEDNAFCAVASRTSGVRRHRGVIWHLWHPHERYSGSTEEAANLARARSAGCG